MPEISVLIPAYNAEKCLPRCLDSVISQSFSDLEIIIVNDASSDGSGVIAREYASRDRRISVFDHPENLGVFWARKTLIEASSGRFLMFVDSDDELSPDACGRLHSVAVETGADIVVAGYEVVTKEGDVLRKSNELPYGDGSYGFAMAMAMDRMKRYLWGRIFRRELFFDHEIEYRLHHNACEDQLLSFQIAPFVKKVVCIQDPLYKYHETPTSLTHLMHLEKNMRAICDTHKMCVDKSSLIDRRVKERCEYNAIRDAHFWIKTGCGRKKVMRIVSEHGLGHLFTFPSLVRHLGFRKAVTYFMVTRSGLVVRLVYGNNWNRIR